METINMFKEGDKYIHFTKYGGVNKGEVRELHEVNVLDTDNLCSYKKVSILTTKGILLNLDGSDGRIYKIDSEMTQERAKSIAKALIKIQDHKHRPKDLKKIHKIDEDQETKCDNLWVE